MKKSKVLILAITDESEIHYAKRNHSQYVTYYTILFLRHT